MNLPIEEISQVVVHGNCPDGLAAAMIIHDVLPDIPIRFCQYHTKYFDEELVAEERTLFCDISPPENRVGEFIVAGAIVLDHHATQREITESFENHVYGEISQGISGAVLAWRNIWLPLQDRAKTGKEYVCRLQKLAGIRDTWQKNDILWEESCAQAEVLLFYDTKYWLDHLASLNSHEMDLGKVLYDKRMSSADKIAKNAFRFKHRNWRVGIFTGGKTVSDISELLAKESVQVSMGFSYYCEAGMPSINYSLRSDGSFDVGSMAKYYEGGGHLRSASFRLNLGSNDSDPFSMGIDLFKEYVDAELA